MAEGLLFLMVREHLSVSFADSSPQGEPSSVPPLEGRCRQRRRRGVGPVFRPHIFIFLRAISFFFKNRLFFPLAAYRLLSSVSIAIATFFMLPRFPLL